MDDDCAFLFNLVVERHVCFLIYFVAIFCFFVYFICFRFRFFFCFVFLAVHFVFLYGRQLLVVVVDIVIPKYPAHGDG